MVFNVILTAVAFQK